MKLLTKEELNGLDSTSKTIEKWDAFLKKAVWNLGFSKELADNIYPYSKGVPLKGGGYLPVSEKTGRVFYKMSWAEKLLFGLSAIRYAGSTPNWINATKWVVLSVLISNPEAFANVSEGMEDSVRQDLINEYGETEQGTLKYVHKSIIDNETADELWKRFLKKSSVLFEYTHVIGSGSRNYVVKDKEHPGTDLRNIDALMNDLDSKNLLRSGIAALIYCTALKDIFESFPQNLMLYIADSEDMRDLLCDGGSSYCRLRDYFEVYFQDYMVLSLNPIDKLMCSTKQAFSSCMSIAKQDSTRGTNSTPAMSLPVLFPTDAVFLVFMTAGKHKNMYWKEEEWIKPGPARNPDEAYKYLKMTCRALTYQCTLPYKLNESASEEEKELNVPRLLIGRQYSAKGEDFVWAAAAEYVLAKEGVSTGAAYVDEMYEAERKECLKTNYNPVKSGILIDGKIIAKDRYGYKRCIYLDNARVIDKTDGITMKYPDNWYIRVTVSTIRTGSNGMFNTLNPKQECDMFKVMLGEQDYSYINASIKICTHCGKLLKEDETRAADIDGDLLCSSCREELGLKECTFCHILYSKEDEDKHILYDLNEFLYPKKYKDMTPYHICKTELKKLMPVEGEEKDKGLRPAYFSYALCEHCGRIEQVSSYHLSGTYVVRKFKDVKIRVYLCNECRNKAIMCDKCKKLIFIDEVSDACLLLPKRKIVCPDCIDKIRIKQEKRNALDFVLKNLIEADVDSDKLPDRLYTSLPAIGGTSKVWIKDIHKQIQSYMQVHGELPGIKKEFKNAPANEEQAAMLDELLSRI